MNIFPTKIKLWKIVENSFLFVEIAIFVSFSLWIVENYPFSDIKIVEK